MDSPYLIFGLLILITGFFLAIAMSIQFCACVKAFRRIQREKARLQEIQEAAAQPPPPYALVVSSCHLNSGGPGISHHQCLPHSGANICCIIGTINQHQPSSILSPSLSSASTNCNLMANGCCCTNSHIEGIDSSNFHKSIDTTLPPTYAEAVRIENEVVAEVTRY